MQRRKRRKRRKREKKQVVTRHMAALLASNRCRKHLPRALHDIVSAFLFEPPIVRRIYAPRPGDSDEDGDITDDTDDPPYWRRHFDEEELHDRYAPGRELNRGERYTVVYEGTAIQDNPDINIEAGSAVTLRKHRRVFSVPRLAKDLINEIRVLRAVRGHEHCVKLLEVLPPKHPRNFDSMILVFQPFEAHLGRILRTNQFFTTIHVQFILYQCLLAVLYLHSAGMAHLNLEPENIWIDEECNTKIGGLFKVKSVHSPASTWSRVAEEEKNESSKEKSTPEKLRRKQMLKKPNRKRKKPVQRTPNWSIFWYSAPEMFIPVPSQEGAAAADMWALGCVLAELLQMRKDTCPDPGKRGPIFVGSSSSRDEFDARIERMFHFSNVLGNMPDALIEKIQDVPTKNGLRGLPERKPKAMKRIFAGCPPEGLDLLQAMFCYDPDQRITAKEAVKHRFLMEVRSPCREITSKKNLLPPLVGTEEHKELRGQFVPVSTQKHWSHWLYVAEILLREIS